MKNKQNEKISYELVSLINHNGRSLMSGHYTTKAMVGDNYYEFDDTRVKSTSYKNFVNSDAYILFYKKK